MDSTTYFAAVAQTLPALMIPIWIENIQLARRRTVRIMTARRRIEELWEEREERAGSDFTIRLEELSRNFDRSRSRHYGGTGLAIVASAAFIVGEAGAIAVLLEPQARLLSIDLAEMAKWTTVFVVALLSILVAFSPFLRYPRTEPRKPPKGYQPRPEGPADVYWEVN